MCLPWNEEIKASPMEYDTTNGNDSLCGENDVLQRHHIVKDCKHIEHASVLIYDWAKVISERCDSGRVWHEKGIVALLFAGNIGLNGIRETLKDIHAYIPFVREMGNESLKLIAFGSYCIH